MEKHMDPQVKEELKIYIETNGLFKAIKNLEKQIFSNDPTVLYNQAPPKKNFFGVLEQRVKRVKSAQTLGEYVQSLFF
ncbi:hypothetical protein D4T97_015615 [Siminovitchia acidinfaciens]|uniref:Uncharacterized protein n=1 Tax=Siminovitchia acidinfaciens TaxID=2321395 RepID=A0A429XVU0_9BACI|nr:hypothetical protein [Siminovitchia acidinfaciens]RST72488.1 hypothetical protein D4T97_015615 [Siminovitchia acidinfaciens]